MKSKDTIEQYNEVFDRAQDIFQKKTEDYGTSWRLYRPSSMTDKLWIKAKRIRTLQETRVQMVEGQGNGIPSEFMAILNYSIFGIIQLEKPGSDSIPKEELEKLYSEQRQKITELMKKKNHDYGEAWRDMRVSSIVDEILVKLERVKTIEWNDGVAKVSEGIDSCYQDIANYSIFALILISEGKDKRIKP